MADREKLIELLENSFDKQYSKRGLLTAPHTADDLIANGVVIAENATTTDKDTNVPGKWIPVTERLPDNNERVLVYHDDGMIRFGINKDGFADVVSQLYLKHNRRTCFSKVTHWMPLPQPTKGE